MSSFDYKKWIDRITHKKRCPRRTAELRAVEGLRLVHEWLYERDVDLSFDRTTDGEYEPAEGVPEKDGSQDLIRVNARFMPEKQLFVVLHECGHYLIGVDDPKSLFKVFRKDSSTYLVNRLEEEFLAWSRGRQLADELGIKLNRKRFNALKIKYMVDYIMWAADRGRNFVE